MDVDRSTAPSRDHRPTAPHGTAGPPAAVHRAWLLWLAAVGAGVGETVLVLVDDRDLSTAGLMTGVGARLLVFAAVVVVAGRMRRGRRWARPVLTLGPGVLGTVSLLAGPVAWLLDDPSAADALAAADGTAVAFTLLRTLHVGCVWAAVVLMFRPSANAWFRSSTPR